MRLTHEQRDYFRDTKIVDDKNKPLVMYAEAQNLETSEKVYGFEARGPFNTIAGYSVSSSKDNMKNPVEVLLDVKNPLDKEQKMTKHDFNKLILFSKHVWNIARTSPTFQKLIKGDKPQEHNLASTLEQIAKEAVMLDPDFKDAVKEWDDNKTGPILDYISSLGLQYTDKGFLTERGEPTRYNQERLWELFVKEQTHDMMSEMMEVLGYDGIKDQDKVVVLHPEQIKSADNKYPTKNKDVYDKTHNKEVEYQNYLSQPVDLTEKQSKYFAVSQLVEGDGHLMVFNFDAAAYSFKDDKVIGLSLDDKAQGIRCSHNPFDKLVMEKPISVYVNAERVATENTRITRAALSQLKNVPGIANSSTYQKMMHMGPLRRLFDNDFKKSLPEVLNKISNEIVYENAEMKKDLLDFMNSNPNKVHDFAVDDLHLNLGEDNIYTNQEGNRIPKKDIIKLYKDCEKRSIFSEMLDTLGYDAVMEGQDLTVLRAEQIKSVDNLHPELDNNIEPKKDNKKKDTIER